MASGVAARVRSSGTRARSASIGNSGGGVEPVGDEEAREVVAEDAAHHRRPSPAAERFEIADFTLAEDQDAAAAQVGVEARQRQPGFLRVGNGDVAAEPVAAGEQFEIELRGNRPDRAAQWRRSRPAGWMRSPQPLLLRCRRRLSRSVRLNQSVVAVVATVENADGVGVGVAKDDERIGAAIRPAAPRPRPTSA